MTDRIGILLCGPELDSAQTFNDCSLKGLLVEINNRVTEMQYKYVTCITSQDVNKHPTELYYSMLALCINLQHAYKQNVTTI